MSGLPHHHVLIGSYEEGGQICRILKRILDAAKTGQSKDICDSIGSNPRRFGKVLDLIQCFTTAVSETRPEGESLCISSILTVQPYDYTDIACHNNKYACVQYAAQMYICIVAIEYLSCGNYEKYLYDTEFT